MADSWMVVGLGNPGPNYAGNRHNAGHMVLDELAARVGGSFTLDAPRKANVLAGRLGIGGPRVVLVKPTTYMNVSGGPVGQIAKFFGVTEENVIVVHDEIDIPFASIKIKRGGSEGGHNGLKSVSQVLGSRDYLRVRVGVGRPPGRMDTADWVLQNFSKTEVKDLPFLIDDAADATELLIKEGLVAAQQKFHGKADQASKA